MSKISALYDDEDALSNVQKAAQRAQMRKRAQASSFTGMECEGILHKLPMKKHGILGAGKDRVFKLSACVLRCAIGFSCCRPSRTESSVIIALSNCVSTLCFPTLGISLCGLTS